MTTGKKYPFTIHADPELKIGVQPTHTHGLNDIGWPEFMIDPLAFGGYENARRINAAYSYFKRPNKKKLLQRILNGKMVERTEAQLMGKYAGKADRVLCFRKAPDLFLGLITAYPFDDYEGLDLQLGVIQIYVKGDDFALTNEYYANGIIW